jgi:serine protease AprX
MRRYVVSMVITCTILLMGSGLFARGHAAAAIGSGGEEISGAIEEGAGTREAVVWVFFVDKGFGSAAEEEAALVEAERSLGDRARARRAKVRDGRLVDSRDLPVSESYVEQVLSIGGELRASCHSINAISVECAHELMPAIEELECVRSMRPVSGFRGPRTFPGEAPLTQPAAPAFPETLDYGPSEGQLEQINVPAVHQLGYSGAGVLICMLDTGFQRDHEAIQPINVIAEWDFINGDSNTAYDPLQDSSNQPSHGTGTLSVIGGFMEGQLIGPAYGADFVLAKTEDMTGENPIEEDWWVEGIEWADSLGADVASSSLGYIDWYTIPDLNGDSAVCTQAADWAASVGITVCNSAGNEGVGFCTLITPADADSILAVGAVDAFGTIANFSSRGPTYDLRIKPEVCAQGVSTYWADYPTTNGYNYVNGTSLSCPLVGGSAALVLEAHPDWGPMEVREALMQTADNADNPDNSYGWGIIDVLAAITFLPPAAPEGLILEPLPNGNRLLWHEVTLNRDNTPIEDLDGYNLYRSLESGTYGLDPLNTSLWEDTTYIDFTASPDTMYYYVVTAVDTMGYESFPSNEVHSPTLVGGGDEDPVGGEIRQLWLSPAVPNPFADGTSFSFLVPAPKGGRRERIEVAVYNLQGQRVKMLLSGPVLPGRHLVEWDGTEGAGHRVASGVYFVSLETEAARLTRKAVLLR